jgi:hypothetical protein
MYIGHYKSIKSPKEFFSQPRQNLDFPTQITYKKEQYSLFAAHTVSSESQIKNLTNRAKQLNIKYNVLI